jgi:hypothetical protein
MRSVVKDAKWKAAALFLAAGVWTAPARADSWYFPNQPNNSGDLPSEDLDFTTPSVPTGTSGALSGMKYFVLNLATYYSQAQCFDITTSDTGTGGDTRIWVYDSTINDYRSLNDDAYDPRWPLFSHARIWISPPSNGGRYVSPVISGYSSYYNSMTFAVHVLKLPSTTTEAQCTSGSTYKSIDSGNVNTFINAT